MLLNDTSKKRADLNMKSNIAKQNIFFAILLIILIITILGLSYAFLQTSFFASKDNVLKVGSLSLVLDESEGNAITVLSDGPLSDEEGLKLESYYSFKLINNGKIASTYKIYLDDQSLDDGDIRIDQKYIHYSLEKNDSSGKAKVLSGDQKIEGGIINSGETINYKLRLWFSSDMTAAEKNKIFKAKLRIEGASTSEEGLIEKCKAAGGDDYVDGECRRYYVMKNNIARVGSGTTYKELVVNSDGSITASTDGLVYDSSYPIGVDIADPTMVGHKYYYSINILTMEEKLGNHSYNIFDFTLHTYINGEELWPRTGNIYDLGNTGVHSAIFTSNSISDHFYIESYDWAEFTFRDTMVIDLTLMFGEENEPSKEWCDKNLTEYIEYNEAGVKIPISDVNYAGKTSYYDVIDIS